MSEQNKQPGTPLASVLSQAAQETSAPAAAPAIPQLDPNALMALIQLLLAQQQESLLEKQEKARARQARDKQHRLNSEHNVEDEKRKQAICTHKKGGKSGPKSSLIDYAVYMHRFVDESVYIRCLICGMKWKMKDTAEKLYRRGKYIDNHTGIGWKEAGQMLSNSTNKNSASEILRDSQTGPIVPDWNDPTTVEI